MTVPIVLYTLLSLLYPFEATLSPSLGGGGNLFERGVDAFISRANKRQLTNKPLIESSLSVVHAATPQSYLVNFL